MFCPSCGTQAADDKKYCRVCGTNLNAVSALLTGQIQEDSTEPARFSTEPDKRRKFLRFGFLLFWAGIILAALLGIVGDSISNLNAHLGDFIENMAGLGGLVVIVGIAVMAYSFLFPKVSTLQRPPRRESLPPKPHEVEAPAQRSEDARVSVTEHTTYRLEDPGEGTGRSSKT